ncbi:hypothetical protein FSARC_10711 [Fusarium sarcochroum]|uniref:F-box domain-containing protein n=1 Tax=Fusarium sarcochroum TaxID=1208366 RepID=A0A8H4X3E1_9HYPO|nr:hypothetical protein FSARC_10711 [Fusarium sarcochroum]
MDQHSTLMFQQLPFDIHFEVAKHLDYLELLRFASTNRHFHKILNNPKVIVGTSRTENFVINRDYHLRKIGHELFACTNCLQLLPKRKFVRASKFYDIRGSTRFCLDCAAALKLQPHLQSVANADWKLKYYFCHNCGQCRTKSERCHGKKLDDDSGEDEVSEALSLCTKPRRQREGFETLPTHILAKISSLLGFSDVLHLKQVSRALNDIVKPNQWTPLQTRYRFVRDKWTKDVQDLDRDKIQKFPCYMCCQIRPKEKFPPKQLTMAENQSETAWKTRCKSCVWLMGRSSKSVTRIEHRRREMCETCGCIKYARKTCGGCLELYIQGAINHKTLYQGEEEAKRDYKENLYLIGDVFDQKDEPEDG